MRDTITTALDLAGIIAIVVGVLILAGTGWALVAAGASCLLVSWGITGRPVPRRSKRAAP